MGEHSATTWKRLYLRPWSATRVIAGVETGPPNVDGLPKPASSISTSSTFGAPSGGDGVMSIVQSATDASSVRPIAPPKFGSGIGSTVRSGTELPHRLAERLLQGAHALLVALDDRAEHGARERLLDTEPLLVVEDRDDPGRPRRQVLADLVVKLLVDLVAGESAHHPARDRADRDRREQRRREQAHREPDAAAPARSLTTEVVSRSLHADAAVLRVRHEDHALDRDLLLLDERDQCLEVLRCLVDVLVTGNEDVGGCLSHQGSPSIPTANAARVWRASRPLQSRRSPNIAWPRLHPGEGEPRVMWVVRDCRNLPRDLPCHREGTDGIVLGSSRVFMAPGDGGSGCIGDHRVVRRGGDT